MTSLKRKTVIFKKLMKVTSNNDEEKRNDKTILL